MSHHSVWLHSDSLEGDCVRFEFHNDKDQANSFFARAQESITLNSPMILNEIDLKKTSKGKIFTDEYIDHLDAINA